MARTITAVKTILIGGMILMGAITVAAQEAPTPTPLVIQLATTAPNSGGDDPALVLSTATWTPTTTGPVQLEPLDIANVRALPSTDEAQLGVIRSGEVYVVTARYENWYQFQYNPAPNGIGWVYGELVTITGDTSGVPLVNPYAEPTSPSALPTSESAILPGTGAGGVIATVSGQDSAGGSGNAPSLPTFTYPPGLSRPLPTDPGTVSTPEPASSSGSVIAADTPPILPILVLGGLGILGLAFSSLRR